MSSDAIQQVLSSRRYDLLPNRIILNSPFVKKKHISYGIILYCHNTKEWLLVRGKHSYAFNFFLNGMYRKCDLDLIIPQMTISEIQILKSLVNGLTSWNEVYKGNISAMTLERFQSIKHCLRPMLNTDLGKNTVEWTFPKGKMENKETPLECAHREFREEAGFDLTENSASLVSETPVFEIYTSFDHDIYETICWIYTIQDRYELVQPIGDEIEERCWVQTDKALSILSTSKQDMLLKSQAIISKLHHKEEVNLHS